MKLRFLKEIEILSIRFTIKYDKTSDGASFSCRNALITLGIKSYSVDPLYTFAILNHEIMEILYTLMGARFENGRTDDNYLFNFNHQTFENAIQIYSQTINKFIK